MKFVVRFVERPAGIPGNAIDAENLDDAVEHVKGFCPFGEFLTSATSHSSLYGDEAVIFKRDYTAGTAVPVAYVELMRELQ